jgi:diguanylate cyclase (GGDEF)-like protein
MNAADPILPDPQAAWYPGLAFLLPPVLQRTGAGLIVKAADSSRIVHADAAWLALFGLRAEQVLGATDADLFDPVTATALRAADQTALEHKSALTSEHRLEHAGRRRDFETLRLAGSDRDGRAVLYAVWTDLEPQLQMQAQLRAALAQIEQQQRAHEALRRELADQVLRDAASGLYTQAHFDDQLRREVDLSTREHREFALVFIELDPPSQAVAALGEPARGRVFEAIGRLLRGGTRAMDASCRYDEHRFAVLLSGVGLATAHARMESLRRQCATQIVVLDGQELRFSVAMGVASFPHTANTQPALIEACDAALDEARRRGGNHVTLAAIRFNAPN